MRVGGSSPSSATKKSLDFSLRLNISSNDVTCVPPHVMASVNYLKFFLINLICGDHNVSLGPN